MCYRGKYFIKYTQQFPNFVALSSILISLVLFWAFPCNLKYFLQHSHQNTMIYTDYHIASSSKHVISLHPEECFQNVELQVAVLFFQLFKNMALWGQHYDVGENASIPFRCWFMSQLLHPHSRSLLLSWEKQCLWAQVLVQLLTQMRQSSCLGASTGLSPIGVAIWRMKCFLSPSSINIYEIVTDFFFFASEEDTKVYRIIQDLPSI